MLRQVPLKAVYRSESDNILQDFYIPVLRVSTAYDRAVGFFSAGMLSYAAQGLSAFVQNNGRVRLIVGGELEPEDEQAIRSGYDQRQLAERVGQRMLQVLERVDDSLFFRRLELLSWLIASGRLDIKVALKKKGMYHEKIGILTDSDGDKVIFQGSANETTSALLPDFNFESINVFQAWRNELADHYMPYVIGFERLWENKSPNTLVLSFPDAVREKLVRIAKTVPKLLTTDLEEDLWNRHSSIAQPEAVTSVESPRVPKVFNGQEFSILPHQRRALEAWKANGLQGIMALATGAGKTITAIYGALKIFEQTKKLFVVIAVPYQNLADQWVGVLREFNIAPIKAYFNAAEWQTDLSECISLYQVGAAKFAAVVVVNRTLQSEGFRRLIEQVPGENFLWIGDECHHHATESSIVALPRQAKMRLGLSATPEHYLNHEATARLLEFYGPIVATYTLEEALTDGVLTPYKYHVVLVDLTEDEAVVYQDISRQIAKLIAKTHDDDVEISGDEQLQFLLFRRARLLGSARNKLVELAELLADRGPTPLTLFYCGDGSTDDQDSGDPLRQVEAVTALLYERSWKSSLFTARESRQEREALLDHFRLGQIDALVAIRCLDEGIDVPACRSAYIIASSRNPKQFIQRRGRILRRSSGKEYAEIYDFVVNIPQRFAEGSRAERQLMRAELTRVGEFAGLAINSADAVRTLKPLLDWYDLTHLVV